MLERLTADDFAPYRGDRFRVAQADEPPFEVELIEISTGQARGLSRQQFSLVFRGGPPSPLQQQILRVDHERLGAMDIFLVPIGPDEHGQRYEAVFT